MIIKDYSFAVIFFALGIAFVGGAFVISWLLRPRDPSPLKNSTYECGECIKGDLLAQFNVSYYLVALIFVIFDVEVLFLVPWAVAFRRLGIGVFLEMAAFIVILMLGLVYAWKKGAFQWH